MEIKWIRWMMWGTPILGNHHIGDTLAQGQIITITININQPDTHEERGRDVAAQGMGQHWVTPK
jgi:hypothetical protein